MEEVLYALDADAAGGDQPADDVGQCEALRYGKARALVRPGKLPPVAANGTLDAEEGRLCRLAYASAQGFLSTLCVAEIRRTVPVFERITIECVSMPPAK